jgi:hypothetical protein
LKAPIDKITAGGNDTIQIVVTTSCDRECSNCTQLLPFRTDYKFMSVACFEEAVLSVKGWPGIVALFGGNPCVHPQFQELCRIIAEHIPPERRGLWTNNVFKHGAIAAATFGKGRLNLNAHADPKAAQEMDRWFPGRVIQGSDRNASWHSAILADYRDFGISEEEWIRQREQCDINQKWSGAIVQRGGKPYAYFCEVAAALDGVRGENSGIPAVPGWWQRSMNAFDHQVKNCCDKGCGVPLRLKGHLDCDDTYDLSPSWLDRTEDVTGKTAVEVHQVLPQRTYEATDYMQYRKKK